MTEESSFVLVDTIFDSSNEILKHFVREMFNFSKQAVDGLSAAAIHITQSQHLQGYYQSRKQRLTYGHRDRVTSFN